jgi:hypothetical protein
MIKKEMSEEQKARLSEASKARAAENRAIRRRTITCGNWKIYRFDPDNFALQRGNEDPFFYTEIDQGLKALLTKLASEKAPECKTVEEVVGVFNQAKADVIAAIKQGFKEEDNGRD